MNEMTRTGGAVDRPRELDAADLLRWVDNPALAVPGPLRLMCQFFWIEWRAVVRDELSFYSRVGRYCRDYGLTADDLAGLFAKMNEPTRGERMKFPADFLAEFATLVAVVVRNKRAAEETERRRAEDAKNKAEACGADVLAAMKEKLAAGWSAGGG